MRLGVSSVGFSVNGVRYQGACSRLRTKVPRCELSGLGGATGEVEGAPFARTMFLFPRSGRGKTLFSFFVAHAESDTRSRRHAEANAQRPWIHTGSLSHLLGVGVRARAAAVSV